MSRRRSEYGDKLMVPSKPREVLVSDLLEHAELLLESCERFREHHKKSEMRIISSRLRVLVCGKDSKKGNRLLFDLYPGIEVYVLTSRVSMTITETAPSGKVIATIKKTKLRANPVPRQPTLPIICSTPKFGNWLTKTTLEDWVHKGFLLDIEVSNSPNKVLNDITPEQAILAFADKEGSHNDRDYWERLGTSFEQEIDEYQLGGKKVNLPLLFNYLYQIGTVVAKLGNELASQERKQ
jgi:hypothetical protein